MEGKNLGKVANENETVENYHPIYCDTKKGCKKGGVCFCLKNIPKNKDGDIDYRNCKNY